MSPNCRAEHKYDFTCSGVHKKTNLSAVTCLILHVSYCQAPVGIRLIADTVWRFSEASVPPTPSRAHSPSPQKNPATSPSLCAHNLPLHLLTSSGRQTGRTISRSGNGIFTGIEEKLPVLSSLRSPEATFQAAGIVVTAGAG